MGSFRKLPMPVGFRLVQIRDERGPPRPTVIGARSSLTPVTVLIDFDLSPEIGLTLGPKARELRGTKASQQPCSAWDVTTLIPSRLFGCLAGICRSHGQNATEVSELPFRENGAGKDLCHPRFVAFMLRLGDLLDLDNGRFCPVLLSTIGRVPSTSVDHMGKHASIDRFYAGPDKISVTATCRGGTEHGSYEIDAYRSYQATSQWFSWLREEISYLAVSWNSIAPKDMGGPPSIGNIAARLEGYELLPGHVGPDLSVDPDYFLELSRSNQLFGNNQQSWQQEIIANAIDATLVRIWETSDDEKKREILSSPNPIAKMAEHATQYPIKISIRHENETFGSNPEQRTWHISISDQGCGLDTEDLGFLKVIGSSPRSHAKQQRISRMPEIFQPTGSFGIGFQSIFLDTEEASIITHSGSTGARRKIVIRRPQRPADSALLDNPLRPGLYVQKLDNTRPEQRGTTVSFSVIRPSSFGRMTTDPIKKGNDEISNDALLASANKLCTDSIVPIFINDRPVSRSHANTEPYSYFDTSTSFKIDYTVDSKDSPGQRKHAYRGSTVEDSTGGGVLISYSADLYHGRASDFLLVNRSGFTGTGRTTYHARLNTAIANTLPLFLEDLRRSGDNNTQTTLEKASLFAKTKLNTPQAGNEWKDLKAIFPVKGGREQKGITIKDFLALDEATVYHEQPSLSSRLASLIAHSQLDDGYVVQNFEEDALLRQISENFKQIHLRRVCGPFLGAYGHNHFLQEISIKRSGLPKLSVEKDALAYHMASWPFPGRPFVPCPDCYSALRVNHPNSIDGRVFHFPQMHSPFTQEQGRPMRSAEVFLTDIEQYISFVMSQHENDSIAESLVRTQTWEFIRFAHEHVYEPGARTGEFLIKYDIKDAAKNLGQPISGS